MDAPLKGLGARLRQAREKVGLSGAEVARRIGVERQTINNWELGRSAPQMSNLQRFAEVVGLSVSELLSGLDAPDRGSVPGAAGELATGFAESPQAELVIASGGPVATAVAADRRGTVERRRLPIAADGSVVIPADWRQAMELQDGERLVARLVNGELTLHGSQVGLRRAQALVRRHVPKGVDLAQQLIDERRREAAAEEAGRDR